MSPGPVSWDEGGGAETEELLMVEEATQPAVPAPSRPHQRGQPPSGTIKLAAAAVALVVVAAGLVVLLSSKPKTVSAPPEKPEPGVNDTLASPDVFLSEVRPEEAGSSHTPFVEIQVGEGVPDLNGWKLTTYDGDDYKLSMQQGSGFRYVLLEFPSGTGLNLDPRDELGLYDSQGRLVDFVRWAGGGGDPPRGGWAQASPGPYLSTGQSVSRLGLARYDPSSWNASPPSPREPNILELEISGARQVLWLRSGRGFEAQHSLGSGSLSLPSGRPVPRALLTEASAHIEQSLKGLRRLGEPYALKNTSRGSPVLEFWITNRSSYGGITESSGRVSLDLGPSRGINAYLCARQMALLIELARWGTPTEGSAFLREGMATWEALSAAAAELNPSSPSVDSVWSDMRVAGLYNPYDDGRDLTQTFIASWSYDDHHMACSWLFYEYLEQRFRDSGLGASLSQSMLLSGKEPQSALTGLMGRSLASLFWDYIAWRTGVGFRYASPSLQSSLDLGGEGVELLAALQPWTAWTARVNSTLPGDVEIELSCDPAAGGPLHFIATATRTGETLYSGALQPGASSSAAAPGLRVYDELVFVVASAEYYGGAVLSASYLPPPPSGLSPPDGTFTSDPMPSFTWSAVEGVDSYELQLSTDASFSGLELSNTTRAPSYSPAQPLPDGRRYWRVRGLTPTGTPTGWSAVNELVVDTVPPLAQPVLSDPKHRAGPGDVWNVSSVTRITFAPGAGPLAPETVYFRFSEGEDWQRHTGEFTLSGGDGLKPLQYRSEDAAGNSQPMETLLLQLDNSPPHLGLEVGTPNASAAPDDVVNVSDRTPLSLVALDALSGTAELSYRVDAGPWTPYTTPITLSGLLEGQHIIAAQATDHLGNQGSGMFHVFLDLSPPELSLDLESGAVPHGVRTVTAVARDRSGVASVSFLVDGTPRLDAHSAPFEWSWNTAQEADGPHTVEARASDGLGNVKSLFVSVLTDNTAPSSSLTIGSPRHRAAGSDDWNVSSRTNFTLSAVDATSGVDVSWFTVDGVYVEGAELRLRDLPDGLHTIVYGSRDMCGNNESGTAINVRLDNTPPSFGFVTPQQNDVLSGAASLIVSEASGAKDVRNCTFYYSIDGVNWQLIAVDGDGSDGWSASWSTYAVPNGSYWLKAEMRDMLDNIAVQTIMVMVQN
ncbi:MAG: OmpL47-type beta-barrel domain-containing protein [Thermoplasmatota archaeon]